MGGFLAFGCDNTKEKAENIRKYGVIAAELIERGHDPIKATEISAPVEMSEPSGMIPKERLKYLTDSLDAVLKNKIAN